MPVVSCILGLVFKTLICKGDIMNRVTMIQKIIAEFRFIHLLTTNELLSRTLGVYLEFETFFIDYLNTTLNLTFGVSSHFPDLEQPFEIEDKRNKIIVHLMLDNNEDDLVSAVEAFSDLMNDDPLYKKWNFYVLMLGLNKIKLRNILNADLQQLVHAGNVITPKELINHIKKMRDLSVLEELDGILDKVCREPLALLTPPDSSFVSILNFVAKEFTVEILSPTVLPLKLCGYADNLMLLSEAKSIDKDIIDSILQLYSSYGYLDRPLFDVVNNLYGLVRKYWVLCDPLGRNSVKRTINDVGERLTCLFLEKKLVRDKDDALRCAKAIIYEALLREKISLWY